MKSPGNDNDLEKPPSNSLADLAGTWSEEDLARFEEDTAPTREIDDELWS